MAKKDEDIFFVEVREPKEIKRLILSSMKDIIENLHQFESFKEIRHQKLAKINSLRKNVKDINKQIGVLKSIVPETKLRAAEAKVAATQKQKKTSKGKKESNRSEAKQKKQIKGSVSELDKLSSELAAIEGKLKDLQ